MFGCAQCGKRYEQPGYCAADGRPLARIGDPLLGTEVGRYQLTSVIGEGGMGRVYLGVHPAIGSRVAVKVLSDQCTQNPDLLQRFFSEARAVNMIRHERIVSVIDMAMLPDGRPYIVMEFIEGKTLSSVLAAGRAPLGGVAQLLTEVLSALGAAHELGIVHRDLKPDNVLVTGEGHAKVLDFGIAKLAPGLASSSPRTATGALLGTPAYMAPEQISGATTVDARTDLYAVGVVLYQCATGGVPFHGDSLFDLMRAHVHDAPRPPRELRPDLPGAFEAVILRALAKDPAHRFDSAARMIEALQQAGSELPAAEWRSLATRGAPITGNQRSLASHASRRTPGADPTEPVIQAAQPVGAPPPAVQQPPREASGAAMQAFAPTPPLAVTPGSTSRTGKLLLGFGVLALLAVGFGVFIGSRTASRPVALGSAPSGKVVIGNNVVLGAAAWAEAEQPVAIKFDPAAFDAMAFLPRATELARAVFPDAGLTRFDVVGVRPDGLANLRISEDVGDIEYYFRSPAHSTRPANVPVNVAVDLGCYVMVTVSATAITTQKRALRIDEDCRWPLRPNPRCPLARVWRMALQAGADERAIAKIAFLSDGKWFFDTALDGRPGLTSSYDDSCQ